MSVRIVRLAKAGSGGSSADINITPLVDVVLVLLIIFMVVTPLLEKQIGVQLPSTEKQESVPPDAVPDQTVVRIEADGSFLVNDAPVRPEELEPALRARMDRMRKPADRVIFFVSHDEAPYPALVKALDGARKAGATTLGMASTQDTAER